MPCGHVLSSHDVSTVEETKHGLVMQPKTCGRLASRGRGGRGVEGKRKLGLEGDT